MGAWGEVCPDGEFGVDFMKLSSRVAPRRSLPSLLKATPEGLTTRIGRLGVGSESTLLSRDMAPILRSPTARIDIHQ